MVAAVQFESNMRKDFPVFDCDSHVVEPPAIWDEYVPAKSRAAAHADRSPKQAPRSPINTLRASTRARICDERQPRAR